MGALVFLVVFMSILCILSAVCEHTKLGSRFLSWLGYRCFGLDLDKLEDK